MMDYTGEELNTFLNGISLRLLSLRSAEHWKHDKETADEIIWLERLYGKVKDDMEHKYEIARQLRRATPLPKVYGEMLGVPKDIEISFEKENEQ